MFKNWRHCDLRLSVQGKKSDICTSNSLRRLQNRELPLQPITWQFIAMQAKREVGTKQSTGERAN